MRTVLIPLPHFLEAAIRACEVASAKYLGIVVVLDRMAEGPSGLLDQLVRDGSSINDVTRDDLLVAIPGIVVPGKEHEWSVPGFDARVTDPHKRRRDAVSAPGLALSEVNHDDWANRLWDLVGQEVDQCQSDEDQKDIIRAVEQSASSVCDYLGLSEDDIPSLVIFSLRDRKVFVFRYGGYGDDPPYQLFKNIAARRPGDGQPDWLTRAVADVASESGLAEGPKPELARPSLTGWEATRYLPQGVDALPRERGRG